MNEAYSAFAAGYDRMMGDVDYDGWAAYIHGFLKEAGAKSVLECACGTGSLTVRLGRMGYQITGSDLSEDMLMEARRKALNAGLRFLPFVCQDMRRIALHKPVDAVIAACDGVNYLVDGAEDFFRAAYTALKPGGLHLFDVSSVYKLSAVLGNNTFAAAGDDWAYIWENTYHPRLDRVDMLLTGFLKQGTRYARFEERHSQRAYTEEELRTALVSSGFGDIQTYEAFTRSAPGATAERLQFTARKE